MEIRTARDDDEGAFVRLAQGLREHNRRHHTDMDASDASLACSRTDQQTAEVFRSRGANLRILMACQGTQPVGYALARVQTADGERAALLDELYISPDAQRRGAGPALMSQMIRLLYSQGIYRVQLHPYEWNNNADRLSTHGTMGA